MIREGGRDPDDGLPLAYDCYVSAHALKIINYMLFYRFSKLCRKGEERKN